MSEKRKEKGERRKEKGERKRKRKGKGKGKREKGKGKREIDTVTSGLIAEVNDPKFLIPPGLLA